MIEAGYVVAIRAGDLTGRWRWHSSGGKLAPSREKALVFESHVAAVFCANTYMAGRGVHEVQVRPAGVSV